MCSCCGSLLIREPLWNHKFEHIDKPENGYLAILGIAVCVARICCAYAIWKAWLLLAFSCLNTITAQILPTLYSRVCLQHQQWPDPQTFMWPSCSCLLFQGHTARDIKMYFFGVWITSHGIDAYGYESCSAGAEHQTLRERSVHMFFHKFIFVFLMYEALQNAASFLL